MTYAGLNKVTSAIRTLSVVIPAFNEEARIGPTLARIAGHLAGRVDEYEIIVVVDGSRDRTLAIARETGNPRVLVLAEELNRGKGYATRRGFLRARHEWVLLCDADLATPIEELATLARHLDHDLIIGSRRLPGAKVRQPPVRRLAGWIFGALARRLVGVRCLDTQCGFKLFRRAACLPLFRAQRIAGFCFDVELLYLAGRRGLRIAEAPVTWSAAPGSKISLPRDSLRMFRDLLRIRWLAWRGEYA